MPDPEDRVDRRPDRRRCPAIAAIAGLLVLGLLTGGCSSSGQDGPAAEDAARSVVGGFGLDASKQDCLRDAFADEPNARRAMSAGGNPDASDRASLQATLERCISPQELGTVLAAATVAAIPGTGEAGQACLRTTIENFDDETRGLFLVGFVLSGNGATTSIDAELGTKTNALFATCGISLPQSSSAPGATTPGDTTPGGTTPDQAGSAVSTP